MTLVKWTGSVLHVTLKETKTAKTSKRRKKRRRARRRQSNAVISRANLKNVCKYFTQGWIQTVRLYLENYPLASLYEAM